MPNFCPNCGAAVTRAEASFCEQCGTNFDNELSDENKNLFDDVTEDSDADQTAKSDQDDLGKSLTKAIEYVEAETAAYTSEIREPGRITKAFASFVMIVGTGIWYIGIFALWIWALALIHDHWGIFWTAVGFFTVIFPVVVLVTCFFWGVPEFFLAFLACLSAVCAAGNAERSKLLATFGLLAMLGLGGSAGYIAWNHAHTPDPITARDMDRLTDDAIAVIAILRRSGDTKDAEWAVSSTRAKARLREEFSDYDVLRMDAIDKMVGQYLIYEKSLEADIILAIERRIKGDRSPFVLSAATRAARDVLPNRIQKQLSEDEESLDAFDQMFGDVPLDELPDNWHQTMTVAFKMKSARYEAAYEDIMGRPLPHAP